MKKERRKFFGLLLFSLLLLLAIIGFYAWHVTNDQRKAQANKPVAICGKAN
jgi:hypothetical protein